MKVLFTANIPSPYRVDFFNELSKYCELTVLYEAPDAKDRNAKWKNNEKIQYNEVFLKGIRVGADQAFCPEIKKYLTNKEYDIIVIGIYSSPTGMYAIEYLRKKKIKFILNSDGGTTKDDSIFKKLLKKYFISKASMWLSTGQETDEYFKYYGAEEKSIRRYPFSSVKEKDIISLPEKQSKKILLRDKLNIKEKNIILSVGQFIPRKGFDLLIKACGGLENDFGLYIIGGKITEEYSELVSNICFENVHFIDFMEKERLAEYYIAADVFVLPTREDIWGLVINEAISFGLPIITTDKCGAGLELVKENGIVTKCEVDELRRAIDDIFADEEKLETMQIRSLEIAKDYTIEKMAKRHKEIFEEFIKLKLN